MEQRAPPLSGPHPPRSHSRDVCLLGNNVERPAVTAEPHLCRAVGGAEPGGSCAGAVPANSKARVSEVESPLRPPSAVRPGQLPWPHLSPGGDERTDPTQLREDSVRDPCLQRPGHSVQRSLSTNPGAAGIDGRRAGAFLLDVTLNVTFPTLGQHACALRSYGHFPVRHPSLSNPTESGGVLRRQV